MSRDEGLISSIPLFLPPSSSSRRNNEQPAGSAASTLNMVLPKPRGICRFSYRHHLNDPKLSLPQPKTLREQLSLKYPPRSQFPHGYRIQTLPLVEVPNRFYSQPCILKNPDNKTVFSSSPSLQSSWEIEHRSQPLGRRHKNQGHYMQPHFSLNTRQGISFSHSSFPFSTGQQSPLQGTWHAGLCLTAAVVSTSAFARTFVLPQCLYFPDSKN